MTSKFDFDSEYAKNLNEISLSAFNGHQNSTITKNGIEYKSVNYVNGDDDYVKPYETTGLGFSISSADGDDVVYGSNKTDYLTGGSGTDLLYGGEWQRYTSR